MEMDERLMAEFACLDPVYVDGIAGLMNLGTNFSIQYFRWTPVGVEGGKVLYQKTAALRLVRPRASLIACKSCDFNKIIEDAGNASELEYRPQTNGMH